MEVCFLKEKSCNIRKTSIGGQALIEGVMMRGPKKTAMTVRNPEGELVVEEWENEVNTRAKFFKLPFIRGMFNFVDSMRSGYKCLMRSAEIAGLEDELEDKPDKKGKTAESYVATEETVKDNKTDKNSDKKEESSGIMNVLMIVAAVLAVILAVGLFIALPSFLYSLLGRWIPFFSEDKRFLRAAFEGVLKIVVLVAYLALVSLMKDIRRTFMFHGAEHKTIFCYESGLELTVENVRTQRRFHPRCGTSFLILMVLVGIFVGMLIPTSIGEWIVPTYLRVIIRLLCLPLIMGIGYELIKFAGRHDNIITRIISAPGVWLQHLTVFEPDDSMIECAIESMKRVIPEDGSDRI